MDCTLHQRSYQYVCKAPGCDLSLLCSECRKTHIASSKHDRSTHAAQIISIKQAIEQGDRNIKQNIMSLREIITPFQNQEAIFQKIQMQKRKLLQERDQIIRQINAVFDKEIGELQGRNRQTLAQSKQAIPFQQIKTRIEKLQRAQATFRSNPNDLKQALAHTETAFINDLRKNKILSSMNIETNEYFSYDENFKHDFFLSRLELKRKTLNNKLLQKVYNESDLYFLIDDYKQGHYLHYFSSGEGVLRIFDLQTRGWREVKFDAKREMPGFGATLYEPRSGRFYLIGGEAMGKKCQSIIWYSKNEGWAESQAIIPRSSAMATLLYNKQGDPFILIAGGVGPDKRHLKDCEIFVPKMNSGFLVPPMNFAVTSGCLVTFNNSIAFRIGGLGEFKPGIASICEIPQKCDFTEFLQKIPTDNRPMDPNDFPKWTYLDLQVVNDDLTKKFSLFHAHQAGIQINPNQLLIFGGLTHNSLGTPETYLLQTQTLTTPSNRKSTRYYIRWINKKPLISAQGFAGLRPIIYERKVMSLQNISCGEMEVFEKEKRLVEFNMYQWREIENIVNV